MIIVTGTYEDQVDVHCVLRKGVTYLGLQVARYDAITDRDK